MEKKKYYLGGPMSNHPKYNWPAFDDAADFLRTYGLEIVSAHEIDFGETEKTRGKTKSYHEYFKTSLATMLTCDAAIFLPRWAGSRGAMQELTTAVMCGMWVFAYNKSNIDNPLQRLL